VGFFAKWKNTSGTNIVNFVVLNVAQSVIRFLFTLLNLALLSESQKDLRLNIMLLEFMARANEILGKEFIFSS
jgi:hypothetical protein